MNKNIIFPCISTKCLLLPICKSKRTIHCNTLYWLVSRKQKDMRKDLIGYSQFKKTIEELFPKTVSIRRHDSDNKGSHILYNNLGKEIRQRE